jgi:hypothetical protein
VPIDEQRTSLPVTSLISWSAAAEPQDQGWPFFVQLWSNSGASKIALYPWRKFILKIAIFQFRVVKPRWFSDFCRLQVRIFEKVGQA